MKIHVVKKGDTLYELAKKYHVELDQIIALNSQITDPNVLNIGEKVKIPSQPKPVGAQVPEHFHKHVVQQGDTLWKLGKAWDIPLQTMVEANPQLKNPNVLMTGEVVNVPKVHVGHMGGHEYGHMHIHHPLPGHHHKVSTAPFIQPPVPAPEAPMNPVSPIAGPPVSQPAPTPAPVEETPGWNAPLPAKPPVFPNSPITPAPETEELGLNAPYTQPSAHPFMQFKIKATEVFAYPNSEKAEAPAQQPFYSYQPSPVPWEHEHYQAPQGQFPSAPQMQYPVPTQQGQFPVSGPQTQFSVPGPQGQFPMSAPQTQFPVSSGGCGCGEPMTSQQPWPMTSQGAPSFTGEKPWQTFPTGMNPFTMEEAGHGFLHGMPGSHGFMPHMAAPGPMGSPYEMQHGPSYPPGPESYAPHYAGVSPFYGGPHMPPYESPIMPQVHTHELAKVTDTEETVDLDIHTSRKNAKSGSGSSKKNKASSTANVGTRVRRQQLQEESSGSKQNLPWINV